MVKNTFGGNKAKKQARKTNSGDSSSLSKKTRYAEVSDELYACCSAILGNGTFRATCIDGKERLCIIRNKFRGKGRRDNSIEVGIWCLVGRRSYEKPKPGKLEKTDLLEVYGDIDKKNIMQKEIEYKDNWKHFMNVGKTINDAGYDEDIISFQKMDANENSHTDTENTEDTENTDTVDSNANYTQEPLVDINDI